MNLNCLFAILPSYFFTCTVASGFPKLSEYAKHLEAKYLKPVFRSQLPGLLFRWEAAVRDCETPKALFLTAKALVAAYDDTRRRRMAQSVFQNEDIGSEVASMADLKSLLALSTVSSVFLRSVEMALSRRYMHDGRVNWSSLLEDVKSCTPSDSPVLLRFLLNRWPNSENQLTFALLLKALQLLYESINTPDYKPAKLPYIPGNHRLSQALFEAKVLASNEFPFEAFYHEDEDVIKTHGSRKHSYKNVLSLFQSNDAKAISSFTALFPSSMTVNGDEIPVMAWEDLDTASSVLLAIYFHKDASHEALMSHLKQQLSELNWLPDPISVLMESALSTVDVLELVGPMLMDHDLFDYTQRLLEMISTRGYRTRSINFQKLRDEGFRGKYSREICSLMNPHHFLKLALLAEADDEFIKESVKYGPRMFSSYLSPAAIYADRSVELVEFLLKNREGRELSELAPAINRSSGKYLEIIFKNDAFATSYFITLLDCPSRHHNNLRRAIQLITTKQLRLVLDSYGIFGRESFQLVLFDELINQLTTSKRAVAEKLCTEHHENPCFRLALLAQTPKSLENISCRTKSLELKAAAIEAANIKRDVRKPKGPIHTHQAGW